MTLTRAQIVQRIAVARRQAQVLWDGVEYDDARKGLRLGQAERMDAYVSDLEAALGDYDRAHPGELPPEDAADGG